MDAFRGCFHPGSWTRNCWASGWCSGA
jgi:hypothetical protein